MLLQANLKMAAFGMLITLLLGAIVSNLNNRPALAAQENAKSSVPDVSVALGQAKKGLRLGLRQTGEAPLRFEVLVQNMGEKDAVLRLGTVLGNGQTQYATAIELTATDVDGKKIRFTSPLGFVAGRLDPLVVPLIAGPTYILPVPLDRWVSDLEGDNRIQPGEYSFVARFEGTAVLREEANHDSLGLSLMRYWTGKIESATVKYTVAAQK